MFKRIISLLLLAALTNYLFGCIVSKREKVLKEELSGPQEKIVEVVFPDGKVIKFDRQGGQYQFKKDVMLGITVDGRHIAFPLDQVNEFRTSRPQKVSGEKVRQNKITEMILLQNKIIIFNEAGGRYDESERMIIGTRAAGKLSKTSIERVVKEFRISKPETISKDALLANPNQTVTEIIVQNEYAIIFDDDGGRFQKKWRGIVGATRDGAIAQVNLDDILYVRVSKTDAAGSVFATLGVIAVGFLAFVAIVAITKESCPFVYSFDGERYVFDAEPLGGAICRTLARTDYSRLEHLKPVEGEYRLMLRNEVEETQYLDEMKLVVIDHSPTSEIVPDISGKLQVVEKPVAPIAAFDEKDMDLMNFVEAQDEIFWQTHLPTDSSFRGQNLRHQLTFEFPKPVGAQSAKLIVNLGTALWGSNMIREMLQLRGNKVDSWYDGVNRGGPELLELFQFIEREELYLLKLHVKAGDAWVQQGFISGAGPLIAEDKILPLDLSRVSGDKVTIRLNPPRGFWTIDYLAVEYGDYPAPEVKEVALAQAVNQPDQKEFTNLLATKDNDFYVMPKIGDWAKINFDAPPQLKGKQRSVFLKTSGYYEIQIDKNQPEQTALIQQLSTTPGMIVEYAMNEYLKWRSQQLGANN